MRLGIPTRLSIIVAAMIGDWCIEAHAASILGVRRSLDPLAVVAKRRRPLLSGLTPARLVQSFAPELGRPLVAIAGQRWLYRVWRSEHSSFGFSALGSGTPNLVRYSSTMSGDTWDA